MGIRSRVSQWLDRPLHHRVAELEADLEAAQQQRAALEQRLDKVEKRLGMAMGAIQAATAQILTVREAAEDASSEAKKALHQAASALVTAEAAADGVASL